MAQIPFGTDTTPNLGDLDANFGELYGKQAWATTGIGYATGAGGAVPQTTSKSTTVTLNKNCGQITMNAASLAAGATAVFTLANSLVTSTDVIAANIVNVTVNPANYSLRWAPGSGGIAFILKNESAGALAEAVVINFARLTSATS